ncbi:hypothetical protein KAH94_03770, partial [bacterium]|nr:hypothetical protein [bacterium]
MGLTLQDKLKRARSEKNKLGKNINKKVFQSFGENKSAKTLIKYIKEQGDYGSGYLGFKVMFPASHEKKKFNKTQKRANKIIGTEYVTKKGKRVRKKGSKSNEEFRGMHNRYTDLNAEIHELENKIKEKRLKVTAKRREQPKLIKKVVKGTKSKIISWEPEMGFTPWNRMKRHANKMKGGKVYNYYDDGGVKEIAIVARNKPEAIKALGKFLEKRDGKGYSKKERSEGYWHNKKY